MNNLLPGYMADAMSFASKKLFHASVDGNTDFAIATINSVITTLNMVLETHKDTVTHGTN